MSRSASLALALWAGAASGQGLPEPLTDVPGDPAAGREVVVTRERGLCILCHAGPFPEVPFTGDLAPDLTGVGARLTVPELRQRMVDSRVVNPATIMPPYHATDGLARVGERWQGTTILTAQEVEDVVAYLATLTEDGT
ncbi:sulfur oxidation c-type cytochrome SoxX [Wenxinia marina]|nr:sulfur oxidation c-type cytochrome SoxX [Wenxinia marina]GGL63187.1 hypothetical protein GCM10011392_17320 [Wenxinia marina]